MATGHGQKDMNKKGHEVKEYIEHCQSKFKLSVPQEHNLFARKDKSDCLW